MACESRGAAETKLAAGEEKVGAGSLWRERRINRKLATVIAPIIRITKTKSLTWDAGESVLGSFIAGNL
jgi:hypothetical protein